MLVNHEHTAEVHSKQTTSDSKGTFKEICAVELNYNLNVAFSVERRPGMFVTRDDEIIRTSMWAGA